MFVCRGLGRDEAQGLERLRLVEDDGLGIDEQTMLPVAYPSESTMRASIFMVEYDVCKHFELLFHAPVLDRASGKLPFFMEGLNQAMCIQRKHASNVSRLVLVQVPSPVVPALLGLQVVFLFLFVF